MKHAVRQTLKHKIKIESAEQIGIYMNAADHQCKNGADAENTGQGHMLEVGTVLWLLKN